MPSIKRSRSSSFIFILIVFRTKKWYRTRKTYIDAAKYNNNFLFNRDKNKRAVQANNGMSKRLASCTPKKKSSIINSPVHIFSYSISVPILVIWSHHTTRQPKIASGIIHSSHDRNSVTILNSTLNILSVLAISRCILICASVRITSQTPLQSYLKAPLVERVFLDNSLPLD